VVGLYALALSVRLSVFVTIRHLGTVTDVSVGHWHGQVRWTV